MRFFGREIPPRAPKEEEKPALAEAPEAISLDAIEDSGAVLAVKLQAYTDTWQNRLLQHNVYSFEKGNNPMSDLQAASVKALELSEKIESMHYTDAGTMVRRRGKKNGLKISEGFPKEVPQDEFKAQHASLVEELKAEITRINTDISPRLEAAIATNDKKNPENVSTRQLEREKILGELEEYQNAWTNRMIETGINYTNQAEIRAFAKARSEATDLANAYAQSTSPEGWTQLKKELDAKIEELKGARTEDLEKAIKTLEKSRKDKAAIPVEEATHKEKQEMTAEAIAEIQALKLAENIGVADERAAANAALEARKPALKEYLKAEAVFKKIKKPTAEQTEEFERAKAAYDAVNKVRIDAQLAYVMKLQESSKERVAGKKEKIGDEKSAKLLERYNRMIRIKEVVIPGKNQEADTRKELLDEKSRNIFQKVLKFNQDLGVRMQSGAENLMLKTSWGQNMNRSTFERTARIASRAARLIGFATIGTVGGTAASVLMGGPAAAALIAAAGGRVLLGVANTAIGASVGYGAGKRFEATKGKARAAAFAEMQKKDITTAEDLEEQGATAAVGSTEAIRKERMKKENTWAMLTSLGLSAGMIAEAGGIEAIKDAAHYVWSLLQGQNPGIEAVAGVGAVDPTPYTAEPVSSGDIFTYPNEYPTYHGFDSAHASDIQPLGQDYFAHAESLTVDGKINDADKLLGHFREQLEKQYHDPSNAPTAVREFMLATPGHGLVGENTLTRAFGFQDIEGKSGLIHPGDTIRVENGAVIFHNAAGDQSLIDADGTAHKVNLGEMHATEAPQASAETHSGEHTSTTTESESTKQLNLKELQKIKPGQPFSHVTTHGTPTEAAMTSTETMSSDQVPGFSAPKEWSGEGSGSVPPPPPPHIADTLHDFKPRDISHIPLSRIDSPVAANAPVEHLTPGTIEHPTLHTPQTSAESHFSELSGPSHHEIFTNSHNLKIDPTKPMPYPGVDAKGRGIFQIYGGKGEEGLAAAKEWAARLDPRVPGAIYEFETWRPDAVTGKMVHVVQAGYYDVPTASFKLYPPDFIAGLPPIDPEKFTVGVDKILNS